MPVLGQQKHMIPMEIDVPTGPHKATPVVSRGSPIAQRARERADDRADRSDMMVPVRSSPGTVPITISIPTQRLPEIAPVVVAPVQSVPMAPALPQPVTLPAPSPAPAIVVAIPNAGGTSVPSPTPVMVSSSGGGSVHGPFTPVQDPNDSITVEPVSSMPPKAGGHGMLGLVGGAGAGFVAGGPIGAAIGAALGYLLGR